MPPRSPRQRLQDILDAIADIERFTAGKTFEQYVADALVRRAVERLVEIVSEASRHVPQALKGEQPLRAVAAGRGHRQHLPPCL